MLKLMINFVHNFSPRLLLGFVYCLPVQASIDEGINFMYEGKSEEALTELDKYIEKGDKKAQFYGAIIHLFGDTSNIKIGLELLEKSVIQGYGPAISTYAGLYLHGEFVPQDRHKALMYYEMAARGGYGPAQFNCGILYKNGEKIPKDLEKAFLYLTLAVHNRTDLEDMTEDAAHYRDQVVREMSKEQYQKALLLFGSYAQQENNQGKIKKN